ncbi:hypothetical protein PHJA_001475600 [Phtheirospermum japonicum]|uniref:KIB1-4 beta-propeller domain-containing protein n=1 Tax=Phtheirospermum japonicum TaxID=374723 RepID=A0A830C552_9LAMI|nr:hypothetical protein PHJA_001475600 [Phtheirospermum japonicum]
MFVGSNHSFAMSAVECPGLKPNSIYFTDSNKHYTPNGSVYGGHDIGIFDYQNKTLSPCHYPCEAQSMRKNGQPPIWFAPRIY